MSISAGSFFTGLAKVATSGPARDSFPVLGKQEHRLKDKEKKKKAGLV